jgi:hypothetical protein
MKHAVEMRSGAMKIGSAIQKLVRGDTQAHSTVISYAYIYFFKIRKIG